MFNRFQMPYVPGQMRLAIKRSPFLSYLLNGRSNTQLVRTMVRAGSRSRRGQRRLPPKFRSASGRLGMRERSSRGTGTTFVFPASRRSTHNLFWRGQIVSTDLSVAPDNENTFRFIATSMWSPRISVGPAYNLPAAHGWSLMATLYDHYFVESCTLVLTAQNCTNQPVIMGISLQDNNNILSAERYYFNSNGVTAQLPCGSQKVGAPSAGFIGTGEQKTISYTYNPRKFFNVTNVRNESKLRATYTNSTAGFPAEQAYFHCYFTPHNALLPTPELPDHGQVYFSVKMTYRVVSVEPKLLDLEATS